MKTKHLMVASALMALATACSNDLELVPEAGTEVANRPSAGQVTLTISADDDSRAAWDDNKLAWSFQAGDKIGALLMDDWNQDNEGQTTIADYTLTDYIHTNYPFSTADGSTWNTPDNAALCEGNYFFVFPYDGTYKNRGYMGFGINNHQSNVNEQGEHDLWAAVKSEQKYLGYAFIPAVYNDVNNVDVTFHPLFATPKFKLQNVSGMSLRLIKLIIRTHQHGLAGAPQILPDSVVLAPLSKKFADVNAPYAAGTLSAKEETAALFSHATLVQNGFYAQTPDAASKIRTSREEGVYEYTIDFGDNYIVPAGEFFKGCAVMPAGEYGDFDIFALVEEQNSEKTTGVVTLSGTKTANWSGMDTQNGSMQTVLKPGITQVFSASFDAEAVANLGIENFTVANAEDLAWILNLKAEHGGRDLLTIKTMGDDVELNAAAYDLLVAEARAGIKVQIDGTIVIPAEREANAIDLLTTGTTAKTTIINKGVQALTKNLVNCDVINEGELTGEVTIKGNVTVKAGKVAVNNVEGNVVVAEGAEAAIAETISGTADNAGVLTATTIADNFNNAGNATVETAKYVSLNTGELTINHAEELLQNEGHVTAKGGTLKQVVNKNTIDIEGETTIEALENEADATINVKAESQISGANYGTINVEDTKLTPTADSKLENMVNEDLSVIGVINVKNADLGQFIGQKTARIYNQGEIYVIGKSHVEIEDGNGIIDVTDVDQEGGYQAKVKGTEKQYFRYRGSVDVPTLQKLISSQNFGSNPVILTFEKTETTSAYAQKGMAKAKVRKILVKEGVTLTLEGEFWLESESSKTKLGQSYEALEVEPNATLQVVNGTELKNSVDAIAIVNGKLRVENTGKVSGNVTVKGNGTVENAAADASFAWIKGSSSLAWWK